MNLLDNFERGRRNYISAATWFFSSDIRPSAGFASSRRLLLYGLLQSSLKSSRIRFMVTCEDEALAALARCRPGLLILTPNLDQGDGLSLISQARSVVSDLRTILLCDKDSDDLLAAGRSMADAVLCEQDLIAESNPLRSMVIALSLGRRYRAPLVELALHSAAQERSDEEWRDSPPVLSNREMELVHLWVEGLGDREASERMGISYDTVRSYARSVRRKLDVGSRSKAVIKVIKLGLLGAAGS